MIVPIVGDEEVVHFVNCIGAGPCGLRSTNDDAHNRGSGSDGDFDNGGSNKYGSSDHNGGSGHDHDGGSGHDHDGGSDHDDNGGSNHDRYDTA
jgi:hypothetical protein